jgi:crossover junction endodeoxyribonuclease RusA
MPYPPSINTYWRNVKGRTLISKKGRMYRDSIIKLAWASKWTQYGFDRVRVVITAYPPDRRRRDLDNMLKAVLDGLTYADIWHDDSQVDDLRIIRGTVERPGKLEVVIEAI